MANLFDIGDFAYFEEYASRSKAEAPEGYDKLRPVYDKLNKILEGLRQMGYKGEINRNVFTQGMTYYEYHWARLYPKDPQLCQGCWGKVFFVIGTTCDGFNIHIDSYTSKGFVGNKNSDNIRDCTWYDIKPEEASNYSCEEYVSIVDKFINENWLYFNKFAKEFGIQESINILNKMEMDKIKKLLLSNHNLILTGAPGTGKTFLAKEIAKAMEAKWTLVQFHPSYDYTDFVEGLRPIKDDNDKLGFERKDGVFKAFCKEALTSFDLKNSNPFEYGYGKLIEAIDEAAGNGEDYYCSTLGSDNHPFKLTKADNGVVFHRASTKTIAKKEELEKVFDLYHNQGITYVGDVQRTEMETLLGRKLDYTNWRGIVQRILDAWNEATNLPAACVFIIDEINRGEISKIFGELFYSIDSGYRGTKGRVNTQYQNLVPENDVFYDGFYIPENVYIIGTMNDIDRSVESMDFAMRRRFAWKEITAESRQSMLDIDDAWNGNKPAQGIIDEIKIRMNNLNACIIDKYGDEELSSKDKVGLTKAYQIGASYFLKYGMYGNFDELWSNHIEGLLYEYLRGTSNIDAKMERLHRAYNDTTAH